MKATFIAALLSAFWPGLALALLCDPAAAASDDGHILTSERCSSPEETYDDWVRRNEEAYAKEVKSATSHHIELPPFSELRPLLQTRAEYAQRRAYEGFRCERVDYLSDGLKVVAYLWRPDDVDGKKLPLIIFNRGGGQDFGKLDPWERDGFYDLLKAGFVVVGTQYRGNDGGEGHDEEGGAEVRDVLNLLPLARSLGYVDMDDVFMMGDSRGAMMAFLAMKHGAKINAVAVVGAETDLGANLKRRPELREGYVKNLPDFAMDSDAALRRRSAIFWPQDISAPVLLMHGGKDWRVLAAQDLAFAAKLEMLGKPHELAVFDGDVHTLSFHWRERDGKTLDWFNRHRNPIQAAPR